MNNLQEYQKEVEKLIAEENLPKAYEICNRILSYDPENSTFIRLKTKIEKLVLTINRKAIARELHEIEHYLKEKQYAEYLKAIAPLQSYVTQYPEIGQKILAAKKLLDQEYRQKRETAYRQLLMEIKSSPQDYQSIIKKLEIFKKLKIHPREVSELIKKIHKKHVSSEIEKNRALINSSKYEDILIFLLKMNKFDPGNTEVDRLIKKVNRTYREFKIESKKDFIFKTSEEMKTLYLAKKYDYCLELARRILDIDSKNRLALHYLTKAGIKSNQETERKIVTDIFSYYRNFRSSKAYQEKNYIKI